MMADVVKRVLSAARFCINSADSFVSDIGNVSVKFAFRHLRPQRSRKPYQTKVRGVGRLMVRPDSSDARVIIQVFRQRHYDLSAWRAHFDAIERRRHSILRSGSIPLIIDAGANNGASARWFASSFPDSMIVAVEPDWENFQVLKSNTAVPGIKAMEAAIGGRSGYVQIQGEAAWARTSTRSESDAGVPIVTIAEILDENPAATLLGVKIDIEGFESDVFSGDTSWLDIVTFIFVEPHDYLFPGSGTSSPFQRVLATKKFDLLLSGENLVYVNMSRR